jgi:uncharacterized protein
MTPPSTPFPRLADARIRDALAAAGAVVLEGPRGIGKTTTGLQFAASSVRLDADVAARAAAMVEPNTILDGPTPRLIDEWQLVPDVWNAVRAAVDLRRAPGQFLLAGSASPTDDITRHTGAGRISRVRLRPLSSTEVGASSGAISLAGLLDRADVDAAPATGQSYLDTLTHLVRGGWPAARITGTAQAARTFYADYLDEIVRADVADLRAGNRAAPTRIRRLLLALARSTATRVADTTLGSDVGGAGQPIARGTLQVDLDVLRRVFLLDELPAWSPALSARARLRGAPVRHLADPALAAALLNAGPNDLALDATLAGRLFESLVARDIRVYADRLGASVWSYRDNTNLEVDLVVELRHGSWAAFEVKLNIREADAAAATLRRLAAKVSSATHSAPAALGVIVPTGPAYRRGDGVWVIPLDTLGP